MDTGECWVSLNLIRGYPQTRLYKDLELSEEVRSHMLTLERALRK